MRGYISRKLDLGRESTSKDKNIKNLRLMVFFIALLSFWVEENIHCEEGFIKKIFF